LVYLEEPVVDRLLAGLARVGQAGSWLGMDLVDTSLLDSPYRKAYLDELNRLGGPGHFGTSEPEQLLARHGWSATVVMPGASEAHYGRWPYPVAPRGMPGIPRSYLITARRTEEAAEPIAAA
jgi:O-methyltransferase involved in polyketide biosynthesis